MRQMVGWVVTHKDDHDDEESCTRAVTDYASTPAKAWRAFLALSGGVHQVWYRRGYVARRVRIVAAIEPEKKHPAKADIRVTKPQKFRRKT